MASIAPAPSKDPKTRVSARGSQPSDQETVSGTCLRSTIDSVSAITASTTPRKIITPWPGKKMISVATRATPAPKMSSVSHPARFTT
jgi:hypothetical protein